MQYKLKPISDSRTCYKCGQNKPIDEFHKHYQRHDGTFQRARRCKDCACADTRVWQAANYRKHWNACLHFQFGITVEFWWRLLIAQSGRCALCEEPMRSPHVDHDHETKRVRGLLCARCNSALGHFETTMKLWGTRLVGYLNEPTR